MLVMPALRHPSRAASTFSFSMFVHVRCRLSPTGHLARRHVPPPHPPLSLSLCHPQTRHICCRTPASPPFPTWSAPPNLSLSQTPVLWACAMT